MGSLELKSKQKETRKQEALRLVKESRKRYINKLLAEAKDEDQTDARVIGSQGETLTEHKQKMKSIDIKDYEYPFENLALEGGGSKGISYLGAYMVLEECGITKNIKRYSGTSAGAITALGMAVGFTMEEFMEYFGTDLDKILIDNKYGIFSLIPNMMSGYGWNPCLRFYDHLGKFIAKKTNGNPDITFLEFYKLTGKELCLVASNVNTMTEEYFHVKTTPKCPIRLAVRMSISIPGVFQAVEFTKGNKTTVYIDGAFTCNYPIHCYDGWWLSLEYDDSFLKRLTPLDKIPYLMNKTSRFRFDPRKNKTLGFLVYSDDEQDLDRYELDKNKTEEVEYPDSKLSRTRKEQSDKKKAEMKEGNLVLKAVDAFFSAIDKSNISGDQTIEYEELHDAMIKANFTLENYNILFGEDISLETVFDALDQDGNGSIDYEELCDFVESIGLSLQERSAGSDRVEINGMLSFFAQCPGALQENTKRLYFGSKDIKRTVGINTGYVSTNDFNVGKLDIEFLIKRGRQAAEDFLRNFVLENNLPKKVKTDESS